MSISIIQSAKGGTQVGTSITATFASPTTAGSFIVAIALGNSNTSTLGISDDHTNGYTSLQTNSDANDNQKTNCWCTTAAAATGTSVVTFTSSGGYPQLIIYEVTNLTAVQDQAAYHSQGFGGTTTLTAGPITTTVNDTLLLVYTGSPNGNKGPATAFGSSFTSDQYISNGASYFLSGHKILTATATVTGSITLTSTIGWADTTIIAIKGSGGGGGGGSTQPVVVLFGF